MSGQAGLDLPISLAEQIVEIERELVMRERVYPKRVADRTLSAATAQRQMARMRAVLATLRALEQGR